ncbi:cation transporter [Ginsengibacter hankyongi]|uniref:Cation transporter n=1 Tax=Ginsengibacter hankyongi TaxID=2607284 RepID=A0A5J5IL16_9BACT|nr:cation diffusion facilitator family transporter [Ginsengibacter hankyongi]KAA9041679.1 cation transporter [Ginsengibacter hankyongi]
MAHHHNHNHHHDHAIIPPDHGKAFIIGISLNALFVIIEVVVGIVNNSMALLTDAGHNLSDVASLVLSLIAFRLAKKKSTEKFTYGYKKTTVLAALFNAVFLLIAIGILGFESVRRLFNPEAVKGDVIAWVAGVGIIINVVTALMFFKNRHGDLNIKSAYLHMMSDALVSAGVVAGGILIVYTGWYWVDPVIGLIIMIVILVGTWSLLADSFRLSVDAVPPDIDISEIKQLIGNQENITDVHHIHIWALSTTENALTAHISLNDCLNFNEKMDLVQNLKHKLMHHKIHHSTIEIETELSGCEQKNC